MWYYTAQINNKDTKYNEYVATHSHTDSDYNSLSSQNANLENLTDNLTAGLNESNGILDLDFSEVWYNGTLQILSSPQLTNLSEEVPYSGFISVKVSLLQGNVTVWLYAINRPLGLWYDNTINLGSSGTAIFPVLTTSGLTIHFYDAQLTNSSETATVLITYTY